MILGIKHFFAFVAAIEGLVNGKEDMKEAA